MAQIPYLLQLYQQLTGSGQGTLTHTVPNNETLEISEFVFESTGIFNVIGWQISGGKNLTNANNNNPIPSENLADSDDNNNRIMKLKAPIVLMGGDTMTIDLVDTSTATNDVRFTFNSIRDVK